MKTILHTVDIKAPPGKIYEAIASERGLASWWSTQVRADIKLGGIVDFSFLRDFNPDMKITALEKPKLITWQCVGGHDPWVDNTFRFEIVPRGAGSALLFRQEYARELNDEEYGRYNCNWGFYLDSLRLYVETGRGKPFQAAAAGKKESVVSES